MHMHSHETRRVMAKSLHMQVSNLTIRAKGKMLLESTSLTITAGRRYGLAGPNGKGKSTLLRMLAKRQIPVPETIDVLLVEQEIVGDER
jgi:ATP-binding cassette, subfamily F, member 1